MAIRLLSLFRSFADSCKFIWKYRCRLGSDSDFVLRVAPLRNKDHKSYRNYFPPPLYGIPPGRSSGVQGDHPEKYGKYGLFLWPDRLYKEINLYMIPLLAACIPFVSVFYWSNNNFYWWHWIVLSSLVLIAIFSRILFVLRFRHARPVLSQIWKLWPESQYRRFLNVAHYTDIHRKDKNKEPNKYWKPDRDRALAFQPAHYAKGKHTIQEVMLHLSVFDYLFHKRKKGIVHSYNSLRMKGWMYLFSPVWISYLFLLILFFVSALFYPSYLAEDIPVLFQMPYWYVVLILIWSYLTFKFILKQMNFLEHLHKDIEGGYYETYLELIPQQILKVVEDLPSNEQIHKGLEHVESILRLVQAGALVTYLMILEIFSSGFNGVSN